MKILRTGAAFAIAGSCVLACGQSTTASATIQLVSDVSGVYTYEIDLTNTGSTDIGTFWYAWVPGEDFLPDLPMDIITPTGWVMNKITGGGSGDGYAIRWEATTPLLPGESLDGFEFSIDVPPPVLYGDSAYFPGTPIQTSFVYEGAPFHGGSDEFIVSSAPSPAALLPMGLGLIGTLVRRKRTS